jgi:hypothetical protein
MIRRFVSAIDAMGQQLCGAASTLPWGLLATPAAADVLLANAVAILILVKGDKPELPAQL